MTDADPAPPSDSSTHAGPTVVRASGGVRPAPTTSGRPEVPGYELLGELGRGGMGVVYKARQVSLNRVVALKVLSDAPAGAVDRGARFRQEAEAVARLQHPNIVQVFEVGAAAGGEAYLALEFVDGGTLRDRVAGVPQPPREAARLVETVARAVHHAHDKRIVHRDLKPANVLLTAGGVPKVADFGLARFLDAGDGQTLTSDYLGTPAYSAPEQVRNRSAEIGPATDVYALGVILYELLAGRRPFDAGSVAEVMRSVTDAAPVPPRRFRPGCPRDLETVCLKCLEKDPGRRYASAAALADDLGRFLAGEPIRARPVGPAEQGWRWCRRNPAVATLLAAVFGLLTAVAAGAVAAAVRVDDARRRADANAVAARTALGNEQEARTAAVRAAAEADAARAKADAEAARAAREAAAAEEVSGFMAGLFEAKDKLSVGSASLGFRAGGADNLSAADLVARGVARLGSDAGLRDQPVVRARLLHQVGTISFGLGDLAAARRLLAEALALRRAHLPADHPDLARTLVAVAQVGFLAEDAATADQYREALRIYRAADPDGLEAAEAETGLAMCYQYWDVTVAESVGLLEHASAVRQAKLGADDMRAITTDLILAQMYFAQPDLGVGRHRKALALLLPVPARVERSDADPRLKEAVRLAVGAVGTAAARGDRAAVPEFRKVVRQVEAVIGPTHFLTLQLKYMMADVVEGAYRRGPELEEAARLLSEVVDGLGRWGVRSPARGAAIHQRLGQVLDRLDRPDEAEEHFRQAVELYRGSRPRQRGDLPYALQQLARHRRASADPADRAAVPALLREAVAACRDNPGVDGYRLGHQLMDLGRVLLDGGDAAAAAPLFAEAAETRRRALGPDHLEVGEALAFRVAALRAAGKADEAAAALKELGPFVDRLTRDPGAVGANARGALAGKPPPWGPARRPAVAPPPRRKGR